VGKQINSFPFQAVPGENNCVITVDEKSGIYYLNIIGDGTEALTTKFIVK